MRHAHKRVVIGAMISAVVVVAGLMVAPGPSSAAGANACANPVLASDLNGWGTLDDARVSRDAVTDHPVARWAFDTRGRGFYQPELAVVPGQTWTLGADDRSVSASGTARMAVDWYDGANHYLGRSEGPAIAVSARWTHVTATFTVPATARTAHVLQYGDFGGTRTRFLSTACDYRLGDVTTPPTTPPSEPPTGDRAADRYHWGEPNPAESDEYDGDHVDLEKWGLFGASEGESTGCSDGFNGHGRRCAGQTTEGGGYLSVTGTADGVTGGLYSNHYGFKYGRVEVRERALPLADNGGAAYHAVPLLFPVTADYTQAEIDFAERDVADPAVELFVHHDGTQEHCSFTVDSTRFHNYAIDWQPGSVTWYVDAVEVCRVNASIDHFDKSNGGAQMDMFPDTGTLMRPAREDVDWIHMYPNAATVYGDKSLAPGQ